MYLMNRTYGEVCAFMDGMDLCSGEQVMAGFRAWMIERGTTRPELSWWFLILADLYPGDRPPAPKFFSAEENLLAISRLFELLDAYLG
ncbi:hypothetical protein AB0L06_27815 [Spirillospora sp. NPDC052269]